jgi:hypothetical protein
MYLPHVCLFLALYLLPHITAVTEEDEGVKYANRCEGEHRKIVLKKLGYKFVTASSL